MKIIKLLLLSLVLASCSSEDSIDQEVDNWENIPSVEIVDFNYTANFNPEYCTYKFNNWMETSNDAYKPEKQCLSHSVETKIHIKYDAVNYENSKSFKPWNYFRIKYEIKWIDDRLSFEYDDTRGRTNRVIKKEIPVWVGIDSIITLNHDLFLKAGGDDPYYYVEDVRPEIVEGSLSYSFHFEKQNN
jgi:hypothetical protein